MLLKTHSLLCKSTCLGAIALVCASGLSPLAEAQAWPTAEAQLLAGRPRNASNSADGGGLRGACPKGEKSFKALMLNNDPGRTTQARPTFWFYVPFGQQPSTPRKPGGSSVNMAKFVLLDENQETVVPPISLPLPSNPGIVRFTLPEGAKPLEVGKDYQWFFEVVCGDGRSGNPLISAWITRVPTDAKLVQQLKSTAAPARYKVLQDSQLWFESVTQLAEQRSQTPDAWKALLTQFKLEDFAQKPIAELKPQLQAGTPQPTVPQPPKPAIK